MMLLDLISGHSGIIAKGNPRIAIAIRISR